MTKILVTGGAGFIGSHLVETLLKQGFFVKILDNFSTGKLENLAHLDQNKVQIIQGDISNFDTLLNAAKETSAIYHEAALVSVPLSIQNPHLSFQINSLGTFNVFETARHLNISKVIYASSAAVYGTNQHLPLKETEICEPLSPYALEKYHAEQLARLYFHLYGISSVGLRYFNVYGERQDSNSPYSGVISIFVDKLLKGQNITIFGDGEQTRDFIYVKDVISANILALQSIEKSAQVFNVGTQTNITINQLLSILQTQLKTSIVSSYQPSRAGDIKHSCANTSKLKETLQWNPQFSIEQGLTHYLTWQTQQYEKT
jgi:nucleoside-diphosphate-sugar epimerase